MIENGSNGAGTHELGDIVGTNSPVRAEIWTR